MEYDFSDEQIRHMVEVNHQPVEPPIFQRGDGSTTEFDDKIRCERDNELWPCPVISGLRDWQRGIGPDQVKL